MGSVLVQKSTGFPAAHGGGTCLLGSREESIGMSSWCFTTTGRRMVPSTRKLRFAKTFAVAQAEIPQQLLPRLRCSDKP